MSLFSRPRAAARPFVALCAAVLVAVPLALATPARPAAAFGGGGHHLYLLGDSVMVGTAPAIAGALPDWSTTVNAKVGLSTLAGAGIARGRGPIPGDVCVVELGSNDGADPGTLRGRIDEVMDALRGCGHVIWVNLHEFAGWVPAADAEINAAATRWPNLEIADWNAIARTDRGLTTPDGVHPSVAGRQALAALVRQRVEMWSFLSSTAQPWFRAFGASTVFSAGTTLVPRSPAAVAQIPDGEGAWLAYPDGRIVAVGDADAVPGQPAFAGLHAPIVGISPTPSGRGFWLVGSDGGVFTYGDARYHGGLAGSPIGRPVVGIAATRSGQGYWIVDAGGRVYPYDAPDLGSPPPVAAPIVGISSDPSADGYRLLGIDGGVLTYGAARFAGSAYGMTESFATQMVTTASGKGYWIVTADGSVYSFGDAPFFGVPGLEPRVGYSGLVVHRGGTGYVLVGGRGLI
jgi:hypothetical protein